MTLKICNYIYFFLHMPFNCFYTMFSVINPIIFKQAALMDIHLYT